MTFYIDRDGKRINPHATITHDGTLYPGNILQFPDAAAALGITEQAEPEPPSEYVEHPEYYSRKEIDVEPYVTYERKPDAVIAQERAEKVNAARQAAYASEADPLFFKSQRGEATVDEWLAKVNEIKQRFPK